MSRFTLAYMVRDSGHAHWTFDTLAEAVAEIERLEKLEAELNARSGRKA